MTRVFMAVALAGLCTPTARAQMNNPPAAPAAPAVVAMPCVTACDVCAAEDCCGQRRGYVRGEALWLKRSAARDQTLSVIDNPGIEDDVIVLRTNDPDFDFEIGLRLTAGLLLSDCWAVEGVYFGLQDYSASAATPPIPDGVGVFGFIQPYWANSSLGFFGSLAQALDNATLGFTNAFQHSASYSSELHNAELNVRRIFSPRASVLAGFRFVKITVRDSAARPGLCFLEGRQ